jgi:hypothetical protein
MNTNQNVPEQTSVLHQSKKMVKHTIMSRPKEVAIVIAVLVVIILVLAYMNFFGGKSGMANNISAYSNFGTGSNSPLWSKGGYDAGNNYDGINRQSCPPGCGCGQCSSNLVPRTAAEQRRMEDNFTQGSIAQGAIEGMSSHKDGLYNMSSRKEGMDGGYAHSILPPVPQNPSGQSLLQAPHQTLGSMCTTASNDMGNKAALRAAKEDLAGQIALGNCQEGGCCN